MQLANVYEAFEDWEKAVEYFKKSVDSYTDENRPSYLASMRYHLAYAEYKNGDKSAKDRLLEALKDLEGAEEVKYNKDVWLSGGYMCLAEMLRNDDLEEAKEYLEKAKEIIDSNPDLTLRKSQLEKLSQEF